MKKDELIALGITEQQAAEVLKMNGVDIEHAKNVKDKDFATITAERDELKKQLETAETTLKSFEGMEPDKVKAEIQQYKDAAEAAKKDYEAKLLRRDQTDWITKKLDEYGVKSPYAKKQLTSECLAEDSGLAWKDGAFDGFDDFMKNAKQQDASLYETAEEHNQNKHIPKFTGSTGSTGTGDSKGGKFVSTKLI